MDNFDINKKLYCWSHKNLWASQNYIVNFFIKNFNFNNDDIMVWWENPGVNYSNGLSKSQLSSLETIKVVIIPVFIFKQYYHIFKNYSGYIFLLDLSIYEFNTIENIHPLIMEESQNFGNAYEILMEQNNTIYHDDVLMDYWKKSSIDWEYLRKNWDFLHWYIVHWLSNLLIHNYQLPWSYQKSLILLWEYFPCLYSYFPEKKVLTCNYLYNMVILCKKS